MIIWLIDGWIYWIDWLADLASINQSINQPKQQPIKPTRPVKSMDIKSLVQNTIYMYNTIDWLIDWLTDLVNWLVVIFLDWRMYLTFFDFAFYYERHAGQTDTDSQKLPDFKKLGGYMNIVFRGESMKIKNRIDSCKFHIEIEEIQWTNICRTINWRVLVGLIDWIRHVHNQ